MSTKFGNFGDVLFPFFSLDLVELGFHRVRNSVLSLFQNVTLSMYQGIQGIHGVKKTRFKYQGVKLRLVPSEGSQHPGTKL